jgi:hypothetical protein
MLGRVPHACKGCPSVLGEEWGEHQPAGDHPQGRPPGCTSLKGLQGLLPLPHRNNSRFRASAAQVPGSQAIGLPLHTNPETENWEPCLRADEEKAGLLSLAFARGARWKRPRSVVLVLLKSQPARMRRRENNSPDQMCIFFSGMPE